jgi:hypothetical protein
MKSVTTIVGMRSLLCWMGRIAVLGVLSVCSMGLSCDQDAQAVFRQTATEPIAGGIKTTLAGDAQTGIAAIVAGAIDGVTASILAAGDGSTTAK